MCMDLTLLPKRFFRILSLGQYKGPSAYGAPLEIVLRQ